MKLSTVGKRRIFQSDGEPKKKRWLKSDGNQLSFMMTEFCSGQPF